MCFIAANHGVPWGASEFLWQRAALALTSRLDFDIAVCIRSWSLGLDPVKELIQAGCVVIPREVDEDDRAFNAGRVTADTAAIDRFSPHLVVVSHGDNREGLAWMEHCHRLKVPYITLAHRASEDDWPSSLMSERLRVAYTAAQAAHFVSHHNRRLTEWQICSDLPNASVVRNPYNVNHASPFDWPTTANGYRMACVARFDLLSKAHDSLLAVLAHPRWRHRPFHLELVGRGDDIELLRRLRSFLGAEQVSFNSEVDAVSSVWDRTHALILPSRREGLPVAIVEAMLCGRPALVTNVGGSAEPVSHGVTGWIAASPSPAALEATLEESWAQRDSWEQMGYEAYRTIRTIVPEHPAEAYADTLAAIASQFVVVNEVSEME